MITCELANYRSIADQYPSRFVIGDGMTALIGPNNSGKSWILRSFYDLREGYGHLLSRLNSAHGATLKTGSLVGGISVPYTAFHTGNDRALRFRIDVQEDPVEGPMQLTGLEVTIERPKQETNGTAHTVRAWCGPRELPSGEWRADRGNRLAWGSRSADAPLFEGQPWDISTSQMAYALGLLADSVYLPESRVHPGSFGGPQYDCLMGSEFAEFWQEGRAGSRRAMVKTLNQVSRELAGLFGFSSLDIMLNESRRLRLTFDGQTFDIDEMGNGLGTFLISLATVAIREPKLLLIDEPEFGLHPRLQIDYLLLLAKYSGSIMYATHSLGLARSSAERIYVVSRGESGPTQTRPYDQTAPLLEVLGEMNYQGTAALGSTAILCVEGATDVKTLIQFLRKYGIERKIAVVPLGGGTMINAERAHEMQELLRLAPAVYAIIDSERRGEGQALARDRQAFVATCERLGIQCHVLTRRATENYLPEEAVKAVFGRNKRALGEYELLEGPDVWAKDENWRIAQAMRKEQLEGTDLGQFLDSLSHALA